MEGNRERELAPIFTQQLAGAMSAWFMSRTLPPQVCEVFHALLAPSANTTFQISSFCQSMACPKASSLDHEEVSPLCLIQLVPEPPVHFHIKKAMCRKRASACCGVLLCALCASV